MMNERLTYRAENGWVGVNSFDKTVSPTSVAIHKLAVIEDIMDKYGIESVEELEKTISDTNYIMSENERIEKSYRGLSINYTDICNVYKDHIKRLEQDRDTWKKACELACRDGIACEWCPLLGKNACPNYEENVLQNCEQSIVDYFYKQAQQEKGNK